MFELFIGGLCAGLGAFYLVSALLDADGWVTVNWLLRFAPQECETSDDVIGFVSMRRPRIAKWMGCPWCMGAWFVVLFSLLLGISFATVLVGLGVLALLLKYSESR